MTNIVVCGVAGRMGQRLAHLSLAAEDLQLVGGKEHPAHVAIARDIGEIIGAGRLDLEVRDSLAGLVEADRVVVNFTTPEATLEDAQAIYKVDFASLNNSGVTGTALGSAVTLHVQVTSQVESHLLS